MLRETWGCAGDTGGVGKCLSCSNIADSPQAPQFSIDLMRLSPLSPLQGKALFSPSLDAPAFLNLAKTKIEISVKAENVHDLGYAEPLTAMACFPTVRCIAEF